MRRTTLTLLALGTAVAFAAGCTTTGDGTPSPATSDSTPQSESTKPPTSTKSALPDLSFDKFTSKPCDILKPEQLAQLGTFEAPKQKALPVGPGCRWNTTEVRVGASYEITLITNGSTLESITENSKDDPVFKETTISSYPAISTGTTDAKGECLTAIGTSKTAAVTVQVSVVNKSAPEYNDSCGATEKLAATVVGNLKG